MKNYNRCLIVQGHAAKEQTWYALSSSLYYVILDLQTVLTKCDCQSSKHNCFFIPAHYLWGQNFILMHLLVDEKADGSSLSSSASLFNKKLFCPLTEFILNFHLLLVVCCFIVDCAAATIPHLHQYIKNKLKQQDVYTCLIYVGEISLKFHCRTQPYDAREILSFQMKNMGTTVIHYSTGKCHSFMSTF